MHNRLIHGYFDIDTEIVWRTVKDELPARIPTILDATSLTDVLGPPPADH